MALDITAPTLDHLLLAAAIEMELSPRDLRVAQKRYDFIPEHLQRPTSAVRDLMESALVYPQGSRAIGATIVDGASDDRFDLDAIIEFRPPANWTPGKVLDNLMEAFKGFPDVRNIVRCTRCIQLQFAFMHLDVTHMNPDDHPRNARVGNISHSPDDGPDQWIPVNPFGFAEWVKENVGMPTIAFASAAQNIRTSMGIPDRLALNTAFADAEIDALPDPVNPLRDAPQILALKLMKRYLNLRYAGREIRRPVSVYLSKIAVLVPANPFGLCAQLEDFARELDRRMAAALSSGKRPKERNPALPDENFNDRWPRESRDMTVFRADLQHLLNEISRARRSELSDIQKIFDGLFGEQIATNAIRAFADSVSTSGGIRTYERSKGVVVAPGLLSMTPARAAEVSRAPAHHFHPRIIGE